MGKYAPRASFSKEEYINGFELRREPDEEIKRQFLTDARIIAGFGPDLPPDVLSVLRKSVLKAPHQQGGLAPSMVSPKTENRTPKLNADNHIELCEAALKRLQETGYCNEKSFSNVIESIDEMVLLAGSKYLGPLWLEQLSDGCKEEAERIYKRDREALW